MFSENPKDWCYFVNDCRLDSPAKDHDYFKHHSTEITEAVRIYTIRQAVNARRTPRPKFVFEAFCALVERNEVNSPGAKTERVDLSTHDSEIHSEIPRTNP
jgi:hypothetical protein